jgi:hypothetical protein
MLPRFPLRIRSFLHPCVLLYRLSGDGCGRFRGVVLLNVSCGSGDGSPCLATTDANSHCAQNQRKDEKSFHSFLIFNNDTCCIDFLDFFEIFCKAADTVDLFLIFLH